MDEFLKVSYLLSPLLLGLTAHGMCLRLGWLRSLARPIDAGRTLRGRQLFGANKTYRGVVAVALGTGAGVGLQVALHCGGVARGWELLDYGSAAVVGLGLAMGAAAMLAELPNSLLKRQLGIAPGRRVAGRGVPCSTCWTKLTCWAGLWLVLGFVLTVTVARVLWSVVFLFIAHQVLTVIGYRLGMRATAL